MAKLPEGRSTLTDEQMVGLTHRLVDTCIDCKGKIEELEERLKAARDDAMEAEAYAAQVEKDAKRADAIWSDNYEALKAKLKDMALTVLVAEGQAADAYKAQLDAEDKLAKAVEAMREAIRLADQPHYGDRGDALDHCLDAIDVLRATIAELTGGGDDK